MWEDLGSSPMYAIYVLIDYYLNKMLERVK